jgi:hypothetical protein
MAFDERLAERIREVLAAERGVSEKRIFGGIAFLICGGSPFAVRCRYLCGVGAQRIRQVLCSELSGKV